MTPEPRQSPGTDPAGATSTPLVVDLDGTLILTDTLAESVIQLVKQSPLGLLCLPFWLLQGRAALKSKVAQRVSLRVDQLPYRQPLLDYLKSEQAGGRSIILATAANRSIADGVASHVGLFDRVLASNEGGNLKGKAKLEAIRASIGDDFAYAGDSAADIPIWKAARGAVLAGVSPTLATQIRSAVPIEKEFPNPPRGVAVWMRALRVHQWLKNLLLFVPLITAFSFTDITKLAFMVVAFAAFSLAASATYIVNDLWDLDNDRAHPRKRNRPFASGAIPLLHGLVVAGGALLLAFALAFVVSPGFVLMLLLYLMLTSAYSWGLKRYVIIDVLTLSVLYTIRILAGSVALAASNSSWLDAFSVFIFLSLALVKRCSELVSLQQMGSDATRGRDYRVTDLAVLWPLGIGAALSSVVVFGLFISAPETRARYATPDLLWLVAIGLIYWLARLWIKTSRGEMHDDPMVYAVKDRGSRITVFAMIATMLAAHFFFFGIAI